MECDADDVDVGRDMELFANDGVEPVGTASASATLISSGEVIRTKDGTPLGFALFTIMLFLVDGTLEVSSPAGI